MKRLFKILKWLFIAAVVLGLVARAALNPVATRIVRAQLTKVLAAPATLEGVSISLASGRAELRGLKIGQPEGFGAGDAVSLGRASADLDLAALRSGVIRVEAIELHDPVIHAVKTTAGMNLALLAKAAPKPAAEKTPPAPPMPATPAPPAPTPPAKGDLASVLLERLEVRGGAFRYTDLSEPGKGLDLVVTNFTAAVTGLQAGPPLPGAPAEGKVALGFDIPQKGGTNAVARLSCRVLPVTDPAAPSVAVQFRLGSLELATLGDLPGLQAVGQALGYAFDIQVGGTLVAGALDIRGGLVNEYGQSHEFLRVGGTVAEPDISWHDALGTALALPGKALSAVAGNVAEAGVKTVVGVAETGVAVVSGVGDTLGSLAGGLLNTGGKLLEGDLSGAGGALVKGAGDTLGAAAGTVTNTVGTAAGGVIDVAGTAVGAGRIAEWRATAPARHKALFDEADRRLSESQMTPAAPVKGAAPEKTPGGKPAKG